MASFTHVSYVYKTDIIFMIYVNSDYNYCLIDLEFSIDLQANLKEGARTWVKKQIKRTANRLFLGSEHRGFQLIKRT